MSSWPAQLYTLLYNGDVDKQYDFTLICFWPGTIEVVTEEYTCYFNCVLMGFTAYCSYRIVNNTQLHHIIN